VRVAILWEVSRASRIVEQGLAFLRECKEAGTLLYVVSDERLYDPANDADWDQLQAAFVDAARESRKISKRVNRGQGGTRKAGRQVGICPYGYVRTYDPESGKPVQQVVLEEAEVVLAIITWAAAGVSASGIALRLNKAGIAPPTRPGNRTNKYGAWRHTTVQGIATNPVYISKITRDPSYGYSYRNLGDLIDAPSYPRIHDDVTDQLFFDAARALKAKAPQAGARFGAAAHLLTHIARCQCGGPITPGNRVYQRKAAGKGSNTAAGKKGFQKLDGDAERVTVRYYRCGKTMHVNVREPDADQHVITLVIGKVCEIVRQGGFSEDYQPDELLDVQTRLADAERRRDTLTERYRKSKSDTFLDLIEEAEQEIKELQDQEKVSAVPAFVQPFLGTGGDPPQVQAVWDGLGLNARRLLVRSLAEAITMYPAQHAGRGQEPAADRIKVDWNPWYVYGGETARGTESESVQETVGD
jgi:hypothetical protein